MTLIKRGRPLGGKAFAIIQVVRESPATVSNLALRLQLSYGDARKTVSRLAQHGHVQYGNPQAGTGGRPARLVQPKSEPTTTSPDHLRALHAALTGKGS